MEDKNIHLVIEEFLGTDGKFGANAFPCRSHQDAGEFCTSQIVSMCEQQGIDWQAFDEIPWEIEGDGWYYKVRIDVVPFF